MKTITRLFAFAVVILGFSASSFGQTVPSTASSSGTIVTTLSIEKQVDMNFGNAAVNTSAGTVVLLPAGTRTKTGGVTLPAVAGTVAAAEFTVMGEAGYAFTFTVPSTPTTVTSGSNTMIVNTFTSDATGTLTGGTQTVKVGATLNVAGSQPAGTYTSGTNFEVTVNYN